jgi:hypothetical protein
MSAGARAVRRTPALIATALAAAAALGGWALLANPYKAFLSIPCPFHAATGLDCPGCGLQRAVWSLLHGDVHAALRANALVIVILPLVLVAVGQTLRQWVTGIAPPRRELPAPVVVLLVMVMLAYWVLRNLA